jgi:hypothetical protein
LTAFVCLEDRFKLAELSRNQTLKFRANSGPQFSITYFDSFEF